MNILITGANGFIGSALKEKLSKNANFNIDILGTKKPNSNKHFKKFFDIAVEKDKKESLLNKDIVIHCAGIADSGRQNPQELYKVNSDLTESLASSASKCGVKKFIFLSTSKVLGEATNLKPFNHLSKPNPGDLYAKSKLYAENKLIEVTKHTEMKSIIIRPPAVYGKNNQSNIARLFNIVKIGIPLPVQALNINKRSFISINNLTNLIEIVMYETVNRNEILLCSDGFDLTLSELVHEISKAAKKDQKVFFLPLWFLRSIFYMVGKYKEFDKLSKPFQLDIEYTKSRFKWTPKFELHDDLV